MASRRRVVTLTRTATPRDGSRSARLRPPTLAWHGSGSPPTPSSGTGASTPLKGSLGSRTVNGEELEQWHYEVTAGGRIWYCIETIAGLSG